MTPRSRVLKDSKANSRKQANAGKFSVCEVVLLALSHFTPSGVWSSIWAPCFKRDLNKPKSISGARFGGHIALGTAMGCCLPKERYQRVTMVIVDCDFCLSPKIMSS